MTSVPPFLAQYGFNADPFESTNADAEPNLGDYFVPPPYFSSVMGDPATPQTHVVLAPRGGGKSAQRRMIELRSVETGDFLCVTYDRFDLGPSFGLGDADWAYHVRQLCRQILLGVLVALDQDPERSNELSSHQKQILKFQVDHFLGSLSADEWKTAIGSIKNFGDRVKDFWEKYGGPVAVAVAALLKKIGLDAPTLPTDVPTPEKQDESLRYHFEQLLLATQAIGFKSTYVLVDRVDELPITSDARSTFEFVKPILTDLQLLEAPGLSVKFFLWDQIDGLYQDSGARPDRIPIDRLNWTVDELRTMLAQRLRAYSNGAVDNFGALVCADVTIDVDLLIAHLAAGSPRDMIRLGKRIVGEATRVDDAPQCISAEAMWSGIRTFAAERADEIFGQYMPELVRVANPTFTTKHVGSDVFHISENAARRKLQLWGDTGVVSKIGEIPNPPNRPLHLFGVRDLRVGIAMLPGEDVSVVLGNYAIECPSCKTIGFTDRSDVDCPTCNSHFTLGNAQSLLNVCARS